MPDQGIGAAYRYILSQFETIARDYGNLQVSSQEFPAEWAGKRLKLFNVIGVLPGTQTDAGAIIIGAHYDSRTVNVDDGTDYAPGADDNGSGVAAVIELARILGTRPHRTTLILVAFSAEEIGLKGSQAFLKDYLQAQNIQVNVMLNLDIIGSSTGTYGEINDWQIRLFSAGPDDSPSRKLARTLNLIARDYMPDLEFAVQDRVDRQGRFGDHMTFSNVGYPAVRFIEPLEKPYHQHNALDTIDDIQTDYFWRATRTLLMTVTALADGPLPPPAPLLNHTGSSAPILTWQSVPGAASYIVALCSPNSLIYDQQFEVNQPSVTWDGFTSEQFASVAVVAKNADGLMGIPSEEYRLVKTE